MNTNKEHGGVIQPLSVLLRIKRRIAEIKIRPNALHIGPIILLVLLFISMNGASSESGSSSVMNASVEQSTIFWFKALPDGMPIDNSDHLLQISGGLENTKNAIHAPGMDKMIANRPPDMSDTGAPEPPKGDIVICLLSGRGFALKGNETHVLRMNVELIKDVDPAYLRDLMTSNKSIEDIEEGLNAKEGATSLRGNLRINESSYSLLNIRFMPSKDNATALDADIALLYLKPAPGEIMRHNASDKTAIAGHIEVAIAPSEGGLVGKGELIMGSDEHSGKYVVLLHMEKPMPCDILPPKDV